jgi:hypothetical protein
MNSQPNTVGRRKFLKGAGLTPIALAIPAPRAAASAKQPRDRFSQLDEHSRASLTFLLDGLDKRGIELDCEVAAGCLCGADMIVKGRERAEAEEREQQEYMEQRDGLSGQAKKDFVLERLERDIGWFQPQFQQKQLARAAEGHPAVLPNEEGSNLSKESALHARKLIDASFEGCSERFRKEVIAEYMERILPNHFAEQIKEEALEDAVQAYVDLVSDKTASEVKAMTAQLKAALS